MAFLCFFGRHATRASNVCNQGVHFSSCTRCGSDMVGYQVKWKPVPRNLRIVWKSARRPAMDSIPGLIRNLPMVIAQTMGIRRRLRLRFTDFVSMDLKLLAWSGGHGLRLWRSKVSDRLFEHRSASTGQMCFQL